MKKAARIFAALAALAILAGCSGEKRRVPTVGNVSETVLTEDAPITMEVTDESVARSASSVSLRVTNRSDETYSFAPDYTLEIFSDGEWHSLDAAPRNFEICWAVSSYDVPADSAVDATAWLEVYGNRFKRGTYRVVREFRSEEGAGTVWVAAEFEVG